MEECIRLPRPQKQGKPPQGPSVPLEVIILTHIVKEFRHISELVALTQPRPSKNAKRRMTMTNNP